MNRKLSLTTAHGELQTPFFMPIATQGAVKSLTVADLKRLGATIVLSNTYHLYLRPGEDLLNSANGLHGFMKWDGPILTDSGGYQVFSLGAKNNNGLVKLTDDGVEFKDHLRGGKHFFTPERALEIQSAIGSDIRMVLDICSEYPCTEEKAREDMERTLAWAERSIEYKKKNDGDYLLFAIVQGGMHQSLREECARRLVEMPFDGYAIGGVSVGEPWEEARKVLDWVVPLLPENKPRYLMGVGKPEQMQEAYRKGIDMFDCVIPTREARHAKLYTTDGTTYGEINILNEKYSTDFSVINPNSKLEELQTYTKAYLRHLFIVKEPLALRLATLHNLETYLTLFSSNSS